MTTARSSGRALHASGSDDSAAASRSSRTSIPGTSPTATTGSGRPGGSRSTVSGKTTTNRGSNCVIIFARRAGSGGTDR
ncbi:MAG: hypothetical protein ABS81_12100 [Pseudonocardia sp. SCN 72-86]|nr:MAG: hypothetical protein ABS81_12100 [Pseudonocardia sp. SCN 72-86]